MHTDREQRPLPIAKRAGDLPTVSANKINHVYMRRIYNGYLVPKPSVGITYMR